MTTRRRRGEDGISFEHRGPCSDPHRHRHCPGLWRGELTVGYTGDGKRQRRKVSGKTKAAVVDKLRDLSAADVRRALAAMAAGYSTAAVSMGHLALKRAIRHAEANDLVARNVAALADTPKDFMAAGASVPGG